SYEAKALGIKRGVSLWDAKRMCPELVILPSDYESYSIYSKRMFEIMRRYTPEVEEYSIDEGFADITGMRRLFRCSYVEIAKQMQAAIQAELDLTVSIGLSQTKTLAKIASDFRKPNGFTAVSTKHLQSFLQQVPLADVWGFGKSSQELLRKRCIHTAHDFVLQDEEWVYKHMHKPGWEIWQELRGNAVKQVATKEEPPKGSVMKSKTFSAPSADRNYIFAKLVRNLESAFIKIRRHQLRSKELVVYLRRKDYDEQGLSVQLDQGTSNPMEVMFLIHEMFSRLYREGVEYRSTSVVLGGLESDRERQTELFEDRRGMERMQSLGQTIDQINRRYGKHKIFLAPGLFLQGVETNERDEPCWRKANLLKGETGRRRIFIPRLDIEV
ncbi:MAG: DNA polymerase IV, partial [Lentisphaerae bacterium]|nr:DNA polymerase IV [Lentisphaerota bacterium]